MDNLGLNERQKKGVALCKQTGQLNNREYRSLHGITDRTALRDLNDLIRKGVLRRIGETGHQTHYVIELPTRHEPDMKES